MHLLIPFAACLPHDCQHVWASLNLPNVTRLLATLTPLSAVEPTGLGTETSLSPPHERTLAEAMGLGSGSFGPKMPGADGLLPWGALNAQAQGLMQGPAASTPLAWAVITPVNWSVQTAHITMTNPADLALDEADSKILLSAMQPYFAEDGITLYFDAPGRWLASGEVFRNLPTAAIDRVIGRNVHDWQPKSEQAKLLRRLQSEMQMLLYTHPVNDQRIARGLDPVNSFWVSGTGDLPTGFAGLAGSVGGSDLIVANLLRGPALREDWVAWGQAWLAIDASHGADLLAAVALARATPVLPGAEPACRLTLCGDRNAITFANSPQNTWQRLRQRFSGQLGQSLIKNIHNQL